MKDVYLEVSMEIPKTETWGMRPEELAGFLHRAVRHAADKRAAEAGGRIRTDSLPGFEVKEGVHVLTQQPTWLVWSRWPAVVPEGVETNTGRPV